MIDEQLYQQATDELNSERRRPHLWARACALANDDHDEARYLYTNLRVEELLAERARSGPSDSAGIAPEEKSEALSLEPIAQQAEDQPFGIQLDSLDDTLEESDAAEAAMSSSRAGVGHSTDDGFDLEAHVDDAASGDGLSSERSLMNMSLDNEASLDLNPEELAHLNDADHGSPKERLLAMKAADSASMESGMADPAINRAVQSDSTFDGSDALAGGKPLASNVPEELDWLEERDQSSQSAQYDQSNHLDESLFEPADASSLIPAQQPDSTIHNALPVAAGAGAAAAAAAGLATNNSDQNRHAVDIDDLDVDAESNSFGSGLRDDYADSRDLDALLDEEEPGTDPFETTDFSTGRGPLWALYESPDGALKAVKRGVSWAAMLFTLPWLLVRGLIGSAIAYALLWIVTLGGLILTGLSWMDTGAATPDLVKLAFAGFALIAFLGLIVVPFLRGNRWREQRYARRGYTKIAKVRGRSGSAAIDRWIERVG